MACSRLKNVIPLDSVNPILGPTGFWWTDGRDGREEAQVVYRVAVELD